MRGKNSIKDKIIFVCPSLSTFIRDDIRILSKTYNVVVNNYNWRIKFLTPIYLVHQLIILPYQFLSAKAVLVSFGGYWALIPSLLGKIFSVKVYIILHGTDCASVPQFGYGSLRIFFVRKFCKWSYSLAEKLLPVSNSLIYTENSYYLKDKVNKQGIKFFFPEIETEYEVVYNGLDTDKWMVKNEISKESSTFIAVFSEEQFKLKGGDLIIEVAKRFSDYIFYIAGSGRPDYLHDSPPNVHFLGKIDQEELRNYYTKSQYHLQLSVFEGFGMALCEAMLCECIPIGSNVNFIPEIIGNTGFIVSKRDIADLANVLNKAIKYEHKSDLGKKARNRIVLRFNLTIRENALINIIEDR